MLSHSQTPTLCLKILTLSRSLLLMATGGYTCGRGRKDGEGNAVHDRDGDGVRLGREDDRGVAKGEGVRGNDVFLVFF